MKYTLDQWQKATEAEVVKDGRILEVVSVKGSDKHDKIRVTVKGYNEDHPEKTKSIYAETGDTIHLEPILDDEPSSEDVEDIFEDEESDAEDIETSEDTDEETEDDVEEIDHPLYQGWLYIGMPHETFETTLESSGEEQMKMLIDATKQVQQATAENQQKVKDAKEQQTDFSTVKFNTFFNLGEEVDSVEFLLSTGALTDDDSAEDAEKMSEKLFETISDLLRATEHFARCRKVKDQLVNTKLPKAVEEMYRRVANLIPELVALGILDEDFVIMQVKEQ